MIHLAPYPSPQTATLISFHYPATMPRFKIHVQNVPTTPVEQDGSADDASNSLPSTPASIQSSPESYDMCASKGGNHWHTRRRRRGTPRNIEKRPYHSPTHVSPPHDAPMTKNDIYFALDCEVSNPILTCIKPISIEMLSLRWFRLEFILFR
jgi:hypothetical protein